MVKKGASSTKPRTVTIPPSAQRVIDQYVRLNLGGKNVVTPYFMNERGKKGKRVSVGKGTPQEIEKETVKLANKYDFDLKKASVDEIREFMIRHEIGVDCSAFVTWVLNEPVKEKLHRPIWKVMKYSMLSMPARLKRLVRPVENISVRVLTHDSNSKRITDLQEIAVGDMIRVYSGHHILVITEIAYDAKGHPTKFYYYNSTMYKDKLYGIRKGLVKIIHPQKYLVDQEWIDSEDGFNWIYQQIKNFKDDSRIVRLNVLR